MDSGNGLDSQPVADPSPHLVQAAQGLRAHQAVVRGHGIVDLSRMAATTASG